MTNLAAIRDGFMQIQGDMGPDASINIGMRTSKYGSSEGLLHAFAYPREFMDRESSFTVYADDFPTLLEKTQKEWALRKAQFDKQTLRNMALAIIKLTAEHGQCTDAMLTAEKFPLEIVRALAKKAAKKADEMAAGGPFKVVLGETNG